MDKQLNRLPVSKGSLMAAVLCMYWLQEEAVSGFWKARPPQQVQSAVKRSANKWLPFLLSFGKVKEYPLVVEKTAAQKLIVFES